MLSPLPWSRRLILGPASIALLLAASACGLYDGDSVGDAGFDTDLATGTATDGASGTTTAPGTSTTSTTATSAADGDPCAGTCADLGASECRDGGVVVCGDDDGDGCLEWSEPVPCGEHELCDAGACVAQTSTRFGDPLPWTLPTGGRAGEGFAAVEGAPAALGDDFWALRDLDGDGALDLVITARATAKQGYDWYPRTPGFPSNPTWEVHYGTAAGFEALAKPWPVPAVGLAEHGLITLEGAPAALGDSAWSLLDVDGDGRPDLVITGRAVVAPGGWTTRAAGYPAEPYWEVYYNLGDRFAATPKAWFIPPGGPPGSGFMAPHHDAAAGGDLSWTTRDLDGDGRLDLVVTAKGLDTQDGLLVRVLGSLQNPYWEIYAGQAGRFAAAPKAWMVPLGGAVAGGVHGPVGVPAAIGDEAWEMADLDGDGRDDLVVTATATFAKGDTWTGQVPGLDEDAPHWRLFLNRGNGFARDPLAWKVPAGGLLGQGFVGLRGRAEAVGDVFWDTLDLDGDRRRELVITGSWVGAQPPFCGGQVLGHGGEPRWNVHPAGPDGFTGRAWAFFVPDTGSAGCGLRETHSDAKMPGDWRWHTADLDRDGRPDLVLTGQALGDPWAVQVPGLADDAPHWQVYLGSL